MGTVPAIQFTQEQARTIAEVSSQSLRHWRKLVPYLAGKSGKAARFTYADVIGLIATTQIVGNLGVSVGSMPMGIESLFRVLATTRLLDLQHSVILVGVDKTEICRANELSKFNPTAPTLVIPCDPLLEKMRGFILPDSAIDPQMNLPFPPQAVQG
ncbi:MAG TPA: hypothetical protein VI457_15545 [Methylococcaceae bacterium]|nr:hypothetical protein [Methylococcaceae bacterium]